MAVGAEKLEQSDLAEVLLTVTEAAVDFFKPTQEKVTKEGSADPPVVKTKVDRIRGVSNTIMDGGAEVHRCNNGLKNCSFCLVTTVLPGHMR